MDEAKCGNCGRRELALKERRWRVPAGIRVEWWCLACLYVPSV